MGWISPIAFLLCHTYSVGDAATLETFSSKAVLSPERGALTGHFRKYLGFACRSFFHTLSGRPLRSAHDSTEIRNPRSSIIDCMSVLKLLVVSACLFVCQSWAQSGKVARG